MMLTAFELPHAEELSFEEEEEEEEQKDSH
jgi:hypothetical protein